MPSSDETPRNEAQAAHDAGGAGRALIDHLLVGQCSVVPAEVPGRPDCTRYDIMGPTREAVQAAIAKCMRDAEAAGASADFAGAIRFQGKFIALGFVLRDAARAA